HAGPGAGGRAAARPLPADLRGAARLEVRDDRGAEVVRPARERSTLRRAGRRADRLSGRDRDGRAAPRVHDREGSDPDVVAQRGRGAVADTELKRRTRERPGRIALAVAIGRTGLSTLGDAAWG